MDDVWNRLSNAIASSIDELGYRKRPDGVFALCNIHQSGLAIAEVICAMYNHVTKGPVKSLDEISLNLTKIELSYRDAQLRRSGSEILYHISSIGDVVFDCDVYPHKINITGFERNYGSMETLIKGTWMNRINGIAALKAQEIKWEQI